jgi:glycogen phosphorylase
MEHDLDARAESLAHRVRHYFITHMGRHPEKAYPWEVFQALSYALREETMVNWASTVRTINEKRARRLYYLSMEYLPGRMLVNNISNLKIHSLMKKVMDKLGYNYKEILSIEPDPGLGNGGLGRLASCFLDSLATQQYPATAYGLRYQYGIFEQQIWGGVQVEKPDCWLLNENPWGLRHDGSAKTVEFAGVIRKRIDGQQENSLDLCNYEEVRALPFDFPIVGYSETPLFNVVTLRLWSTKESPHNFHLQRYNAGQIGPAAENTALTDVLYPNDLHETGKRIRMKQEFLLVSASLQDMIQRYLEYHGDWNDFADQIRIQINDTHPALVVSELVRLLTSQYGFAWERALETTCAVVGYTNHTILAEALEQWDKERFACLLPRQLAVIEQINMRLCVEVRKRYPNDEEKIRRMSIVEGGQIRMAHLAIYGSHRVNGVAKIHGEILKNKIFKDFYEMYPEKFTSITNGVSQRHWIWHCNPLLADFLNERIGRDWLTDFSQINRLVPLAKDPQTQAAFLEIKKENKRLLIRYLYEHNPIRNAQGDVVDVHPFEIDGDSLFTVQVKRVHEYKRQLMNALHVIMLYFDLLENPQARPIKRTVIVAGKAAAGYLIAKDIIQLFYCIARKINHDPALQGKLKVVFVENYSVTRAEMIIPAAELSEQISTAGLEASGTGNMKLAINGALTIGTEDGANIEMREAIGDPWWPFSFGAKVHELEVLVHSDRYNPWDIYSNNTKIKRTMDALTDGTFASTPSEETALRALFDVLMRGNNGGKTDQYFVLYDLPSYYATQLKVDALYADPAKWAETALNNIAGMGKFSSDYAIRQYAEQIWGLKKLPVDPEIVAQVRSIYEASTYV